MDAELPHPRPKRARAQAQNPGGAGRAFNTPVSTLKYALNVSALDVSERQRFLRHRLHVAVNRHAGEVREIEDPIPRQNHRLLNHVLELADVTRPVVALERLK